MSSHDCVAVIGQTPVQCFNVCGVDAVTLPLLTTSAAECCNGGGGAFVRITDDECSDCSTLTSEFKQL